VGFVVWIMGRIKNTQIKRMTKKLMELYGDKIEPDFNKNKKLIDGFVVFGSKKLRNVVAGYATRLAREKKD